ncbi:fatty acid desaturase [Verminephrobacter eiseniae]|uniref:Rieske (2Fe-2S) domain protein n=1 Tax=Verminephrobacter eiseniae (strain EF01-2) TaxID=391735 RepID=A1WJR6_VEREI|nr:fatty acid desaturase [Verminephrobacter eiseniae]ABM57873.1 Rieske (2Fe-2S) domain protein [Verminephrobacter eiseniae EF01-2]MCW5283480.1 NADH:ubiquinone reductase (Na(+)-transporting) subunit F [Verminephrobacter eiseniae]MCW5301189.1 NADH:ubiquinone reductase (Na(+)-transporting) subunit F [Verminephrobacter eiseniae]MCW8180185.1 NADH:ubiquinone reductase (Na(+)-transporting) subunit F [Verminephrobacter eiseniae]MCW8189203.1 NADH:ubiquinone reductase (Na(+)-transporting) subunit F [Ver
MSTDSSCGAAPARYPDYSLTGLNARLAIERGLAEAQWYQSPVARDRLRALLERRDGPALRDTMLWFALLLLTAWASLALWGSWWALLPYMAYAVLYATASDSRWHETSHGTAFKTDWMNDALYEIASFMVMRESVVWRWSHNRHHSDTLIVGRDPEIQVTRPPDLRALCLSVFNIGTYRSYFPSLLRHAGGQMTDAEKTFIPASEFPKAYRNARIVLAIHGATVLAALLLQSWGPIFLIILPHLFGNWLMIVHNTTQHAGLAEDTLDHRLNCRTVYMNPLSRFIYWNMNYHVEHHQYPLVPYHALPRLHELIKDDCPPPYRSIAQAWREILPAVLRQTKDPDYHVRRPLPAAPAPKPAEPPPGCRSTGPADAQGWVDAGAASDLRRAEARRFDHDRKTYALVRTDSGALYATDGICTHGNNHLADGLVKGSVIECPKHNGRFNLTDGSPARAPVCRGLATYPLQERAGRLCLNVLQAGGAGARKPGSHALRVLGSRHVATFIKELVLEPVDPAQSLAFVPGDYLQLDIPAYGEIALRDLDVPAPYAQAWKEQGLFDLVARHQEPAAARRNNYSLASNAALERPLRLNVRIATPPAGQDCPVGIGSAYMFALKPGDQVTAIGPFGDFHIKPTRREMVYIGGGAGMAPLRAHLSHLLETENSARKISFWYGARSRQELFYDDLFGALAQKHSNFSFHLALSAPLAQDAWTGLTGPVDQVVLQQYLRTHPDPRACEYYLCGPPAMVRACCGMLGALDVPGQQIAYDEF